MCVATIFFCAAAAKEVKASGNAMRISRVGKVTIVLAGRASATAEKVLADSQLVDIMGVSTSIPEGAVA